MTPAISKPKLASLLCTLLLAVPTAAAAQEAEPTAPGEPVAAEETAAAEQAPAEAAPAAEPQPAPAARTAQDDTSGLNEYSEGGVPTPTGEADPEPVAEDPAPTNTGSAPAPTTTTAPTATTAAETDTTGLPRTGAESWAIGLIGMALLAAGLFIRRRDLAALRS